MEGLRPIGGCGGDGGYALEVNFSLLESKSHIVDLPAAIEGSPLEALACIAIAAHEVDWADCKGRVFSHNVGRRWVRIQGLKWI